MYLRDIEVTDRLGGDHHPIGAGHQKAFGQRVEGTLSLVDVDFGADHDRHSREDRGKPAVQARREQERVDDLRLNGPKVTRNPEYVARTPHARCEPQDGDRRPGAANLVANRSCLMNAADGRREPARQPSNEVEDHFLGAADHERVSKVDNSNGGGGHAACAR